MDNETIISLLTKQENSIKDLMEGQGAVISARLDAKIDQKFAPLDAKIDSVIAHNDRQNGWIEEHTLKLLAHDDRMDDVEADSDDFQRVKRFATKRWYVILAGIVLVALATSWSYHHINFIKSIEERFKIDIVDE